jgi:site-specific recombinase XerD
MITDYSISIVLDTRRVLANGKYPVKLRVFTPNPRTQKLYSLKFTINNKVGNELKEIQINAELKKDEFKSIWETTKPRKEHEIFRTQLITIQNEAKNIAKELKNFNIEVFEKAMFGIKFDKENVIEHYEQTILKLKNNGQISTASNYNLSLKSIIKFIEATKFKTPQKISFHEITKDFLEKYESYMLNELDNSRTTISMYIRALRTIFNKAINENTIDKSFYPFGKNNYTPPSTKKVKKALSDIQLKMLLEGKPQTPEQEKAKAFWFFSYSCNGMNIKDIVNLKFKDIQGETFSFYRAKTLRTKKDDLTEVVVYLTDFSKQVIEQYGNENKSPNNFVFPILESGNDKEIHHMQTQNFTRFINQHFKKYALSLGITEDISTYWARHSFATRAIRIGLSMEFVSEALNHSDLKTTKNYFSGFTDEVNKINSDKLMNF